MVIALPNIGRTIVNTFVLAGGTLVLALTFGTFFGWSTGQLSPRYARVASILTTSSLFVPPIAGVIGWIFLFSPRIGYANVLLRATPFFDGSSGPVDIRSLSGIIVIDTIYLIPFVFLYVSTAAARGRSRARKRGDGFRLELGRRPVQDRPAHYPPGNHLWRRDRDASRPRPVHGAAGVGIQSRDQRHNNGDLQSARSPGNSPGSDRRISGPAANPRGVCSRVPSATGRRGCEPVLGCQQRGRQPKAGSQLPDHTHHHLCLHRSCPRGHGAAHCRAFTVLVGHHQDRPVQLGFICRDLAERNDQDVDSQFHSAECRRCRGSACRLLCRGPVHVVSTVRAFQHVRGLHDQSSADHSAHRCLGSASF